MEREDAGISHLALRVQLSATAVATSFVMIALPNVETITLMAFLLGFLFPVKFAILTTLTMVVTWEVLVSMVFAFSGINFPFKIVAWLCIVFFGVVARRIRARYFFEFAVFGALAALFFDLLLTSSIAILLINSKTAFIPALLSSLVFGAIFTISHVASNAIFFSFIPIMLRTILPVLHSSYSELTKIPRDYFEYIREMKEEHGDSINWHIMKQQRKRVAIYLATGFMIVLLLTSGLVIMLRPEAVDATEQTDVRFTIDYDGVLPTDEFTLDTPGNRTVLMILQSLVPVNYTLQYLGRPFITAINGVWQNQNLTNHYWVFLVNEASSLKGANQTYVRSGDTVEWRYT